MAKILRKSYEHHEAQCPKLSVSVGQKSMFRHCCVQDVKDGIQILVYRINKESVTNFSQFISVKGKVAFTLEIFLRINIYPHKNLY